MGYKINLFVVFRDLNNLLFNPVSFFVIITGNYFSQMFEFRVTEPILIALLIKNIKDNILQKKLYRNWNFRIE